MSVSLSHTGIAPAAHTRAEAPQNSPDFALVQRIAAGDQFAMRTLYARHHVALYRFVLRIVHEEMLAEDVLSETFFDVWRQAARFEGRASVKTWLLAIARHKALSACRRRPLVSLEEAVAAAIPDPGDNPEIAIEKKRDCAALRSCLSRLAPDHCEVIDLVYYHEQSIAEAAAILGIPQSTVKTRMFYARRKLAQLLPA